MPSSDAASMGWRRSKTGNPAGPSRRSSKRAETSATWDRRRNGRTPPCARCRWAQPGAHAVATGGGADANGASRSGVEWLQRYRRGCRSGQRGKARRAGTRSRSEQHNTGTVVAPGSGSPNRDEAMDETQQRTGRPAGPALGGCRRDPGRELGQLLCPGPGGPFGHSGGFRGARRPWPAITLVFEVPANALQVAVGRARQRHQRRRRRAPRPGRPGHCWSKPAPWVPGCAECCWRSSPLVERFLHLPSVTSALLLGAYALPVGLSVVPKGVLAGQGRWPLLSTGLLAGMAVRLVGRRDPGAHEAAGSTGPSWRWCGVNW